MFKQSQITSFSLVMEYDQDAPQMIIFFDEKKVKEEIEMGRSARQKKKRWIQRDHIQRVTLKLKELQDKKDELSLNSLLMK